MAQEEGTSFEANRKRLSDSSSPPVDEICAGCEKKFYPTDTNTKYSRHQKYHSNCFKCKHCGIKLKKNCNSDLKGNELRCQKCQVDQETKFTKCSCCKKPFGVDSCIVIRSGNLWHANCWEKEETRLKEEVEQAQGNKMQREPNVETEEQNDKSESLTIEEVTSEEITSELLSEDVTSEDVASEDVTTEDVISSDIYSEDDTCKGESSNSRKGIFIAIVIALAAAIIAKVIVSTRRS